MLWPLIITHPHFKELSGPYFPSMSSTNIFMVWCTAKSSTSSWPRPLKWYIGHLLPDQQNRGWILLVFPKTWSANYSPLLYLAVTFQRACKSLLTLRCIALFMFCWNWPMGHGKMTRVTQKPDVGDKLYNQPSLLSLQVVIVLCFQVLRILPKGEESHLY